MDQKKTSKLKQLICSLILATDMSHHQSSINALQEIEIKENKPISKKSKEVNTIYWKSRCENI